MKLTPKFSALVLLMATGIATGVFADQGKMGGPGMLPFERFDEIDANKNGSITKDEIAAFMAARVTEADANKDGRLSAEELVSMHEKAEAARKLQRATQMITKMDGDGDGFLTPAEMAAAPGPGKMFDRADANSDLALSREEIEAMRDEMHEGGKMGKHGRHHGLFGWMQDAD